MSVRLILLRADKATAAKKIHRIRKRIRMYEEKFDLAGPPGKGALTLYSHSILDRAVKVERQKNGSLNCAGDVED